MGNSGEKQCVSKKNLFYKRIVKYITIITFCKPLDIVCDTRRQGQIMKSYVIHLLRHGTSEGNLQGQYIGRTDSPLSAEGKRALLQLKAEGSYPKADAYFSSPLSRCVDSLKILYPEAKPVLVDGFRETDFGAWEGKTAAQLQAEDPRFSAWMQGKGEPVTPPGGEDGAAFMHRVCAAFEQFVQDRMRDGVTSAVVMTHGGVLMTILAAYGLPRARFYDWMTESGCGYSLRITPGLWMRSMVAEVYERIPILPDSGKAEREYTVMDTARAAADLLWRETPEEPKKED